MESSDFELALTSYNVRQTLWALSVITECRTGLISEVIAPYELAKIRVFSVLATMHYQSAFAIVLYYLWVL